MMDTTVLIAEDEPLLAQALRAELSRQWPELRCVGIAQNGLQAIELAVREMPDIAFLDIRMPSASGLEVAQTIAEDWDCDRPPPLLVFVTAYDDFAVQAFEKAAVDYLLKPLQPQRLAQSLQRIRERLATQRSTLARAEQTDTSPSDRVASPGLVAGRANNDAPMQALIEQLHQVMRQSPDVLAQRSGQTAQPLRSIRASVGDTVHVVPIEDVVYLQASDKYVCVVTADAEFLIREPLKELLLRLDLTRFAQIHRGTIVNLDQVSAAIRDDRGRMHLTLHSHPTLLPVSRMYTHLFRPM